MIDPHVHCRDGNEAYKETIAHAFEIAHAQGVEILFDMPNTQPPILSEQDVLKRLTLVSVQERKNYFLYMGLAANDQQIAQAVRCYNTYKEIVGFKLYAGTSVGNLAVIKEEDQKFIYQTLVTLHYRGVLVVHCEKESYFKNVWNPQKPITHARARPKKAEIESVKDQIHFVKETNFKGVLHICHISSPEAVTLVQKAKREIRITCGVTPHHLLWDENMLKRPDGLLYKTNPPLRSKRDVAKMRTYLKEGKIDWIETDHAPHHLGEKLYPPHLSGYPSLYLYKYLVKEFLPRSGMREEQIKQVTYQHIVRTFGAKL